MLSALQNKTYCTVSTHCSDFKYTESEISDFQLRMCINTKLNGKAKMKGRQKKLHFSWLVTSISLYWKSIAVRTENKRIKKIKL